jgi:hypothetical protein
MQARSLHVVNRPHRKRVRIVDIDTMGEVLGDDDLDGMSVVGARRGAMLRVPRRPAWRGAVAPGVAMPGEGLEPLPLTNALNGVFVPASAVNQDFTARPQRPFRAERLLALVRRSAGATAVVIRIRDGIFVGTQLQFVEVGDMDLEFFGPTAFGVRLNLASATPGMLIRIPITIVNAIPAGETVTVDISFLGRSIR